MQVQTATPKVRPDDRILPRLDAGAVPISLVAAALATFAWLAARAATQSITIDEADSFLTFVIRGPSELWYRANSNHLLNTLLERLSWKLFGVSPLVVRLPALLGAVIYLVSAVKICTRFSGSIFRMMVFVCLAANPFIADYLVAARGYSLATGFLLAAIAAFWSALDRDPDAEALPLRHCAWASVLLGLSFAANFSFAIADGLTGLVFLLLLAMRFRSQRRLAALLLWGALPGALVAFFLCGSVLVNWRMQEFVYGSRSLAQMLSTLGGAIFPEPNPDIINPQLYRTWRNLGSDLWWIAVGVLAWEVAVLFVRLPARKAPRRVSLKGKDIPAAVGIILLATGLLHWGAFHVIGLLLPKTRTGLFFAPLLTLLLASSTEVLRRNSDFRRLAIPGVALLGICSVYFLSCLRLHYFAEWNFDQNNRELFWAARNAEQRCGIHEFASLYLYVGALNFYRLEHPNDTLEEFSGHVQTKIPPDKQGYVLYYPDEEQFIKSNHLFLWYNDTTTGAVVALRSCPAK